MLEFIPCYGHGGEIYLLIHNLVHSKAVSALKCYIDIECQGILFSESFLDEI